MRWMRVSVPVTIEFERRKRGLGGRSSWTLVVGASPADGSAGTAPRVGGSLEGGTRVSGGPADPLNDRSQTLTEALSLTDGLTWKT
jgi:hypothetical protein